MTGLTNGTAYTFTVAAINAVGTGSQSAASNSVTPPTSAGCTHHRHRHRRATPRPSLDLDGPGRPPVVRPSPATWSRPTSAAWPRPPRPSTSTATTETVTGLTNGTAYTFTVAAINAVGTGRQSAASNSVTPATTPGAPTIGTATSGNASATVTWTAPASNGGSAITGYVVTPYIGGTAQTAQTFNSTATTETVTGLTNGTAYTFKVAAINSVGTGAQSAASNSVTPATAAGRPDHRDRHRGQRLGHA